MASALSGYLRKNDIKAHTVIITSFDEFDYAIKAIKYNVDDFLLKPVNKMELYHAIYKALGKKGEEGQP